MKHLLLAAVAAVSLGVVAPAYAAGDAAAGQAKSTACAMCHGANGEGNAVGPKIAGKSAADIATALGDYASGKKDNAMMKAQASALSPEDVANLGAYYSSIK